MAMKWDETFEYLDDASNFKEEYHESCYYYKKRQSILWNKVYINGYKDLYIRSFAPKDKQSLLFMMHYENNSNIGAFITLTNSYCLSASSHSPNYNRILDQLDLRIPVIYTEIGGCKIVGRLSVGNKYGLLLPDTTTDMEIEHLKNHLPDSVKMKCIEEKLSALGNVIVCNDHIALIHPELDKETEEIIQDTLNVEVIRKQIGGQSLVGSFCILNNCGALVHSKTNPRELEELSDLLQLPVGASTVSKGNDCISSGVAVNDNCGFIGMDSRPNEIIKIESTLGFYTS